jgi:hypothetical protein
MRAQLYNRTPVLPAVAEKGYLDAYTPNVTTIIQKALNHNLQRLATGCNYAYTWPSNGDDYDPREMKIAGAEERLLLAVRVTVFPGLKVSLSEADDASFEMASEAAVRVQRPGRPRSRNYGFGKLDFN